MLKPGEYRRKSAQEVAELLQAFEAKNDVWKYEIDSWCAWTIIRFRVSFALLDLPRDPAPIISPGQLWYWPFIAIKEIPRWLFPPKKKYFFRTVSTSRNELVNGLYKDGNFDDLLLRLESHIKIERINSREFYRRGKKALVRSHMTSAVLDILAYALSYISSTPSIRELSNLLSQAIIKDLGLGQFTPTHVRRRFMFFYWHKRFYAWLLRKIDPQFVIYTNTGEYALIAAAKELGIKSIEYQHGIFYRYDDYAMGKNAVPYKKKILVPDHIFLYGDYWKNELAAGGFYQNELVTVGNIRLEKYRQLRDQRQSLRNGENIRLLLTTQGIDTRNLIDFISQLIQLAEKELDFSITIKLHPVHENSKKLYLEIFGNNQRVQVLGGTEQPSTMDLLVEADFHLSIASACHYDALGMGVPTIIIALTDHETVLPLYQAGYAFLAKTPGDLLSIIRNNLNKDKVQLEDREHFCAPNALENFLKEIT